MKERGITIPILVIGIIITGVIAGTLVYLVTPKPEAPETEKVMLAVLIPSDPEELEWFDDRILDMYMEEHPDVDFAVDLVPRATMITLRKREFTENKGRYDIVSVWSDSVMLAHSLGAVYWPDELDLIVPEYKDQCREVAYSQFMVDGRLGSWPITHNNYHALHYRRDLFEDPEEKAAFEEQYGYELGPPQTWDEYRDAAEFFNRPDEGLYGTFISGGVSWCMGASGPTKFMRNMTGYEYMDDEGNVIADTPEARQAWEFAKEITKYCPPGWEGTDWFTALTWFKQGRFALFYNWSFFWQDFYNPEEVPSDLIGQFGVTAVPAAPNGNRYVRSGAHSWVIPINAPHAEAAAEFLRWMQSYDVQKEIALSGKIFWPAGEDVREDPDVSVLYHFDTYFPHPGQEEVEAVILPFIEWRIFDEKVELISHAWMQYTGDEWTVDETLSWLQDEIEKLVAKYE